MEDRDGEMLLLLLGRGLFSSQSNGHAGAMPAPSPGLWEENPV